MSSPISSVGSTSSNNAAAIYQQRLTAQLAEKQAAKVNAATTQSPAAPAASVQIDRDNDGDSH